MNSHAERTPSTPPRFVFHTVASRLHDEASLRSLTGVYATAFESLGGAAASAAPPAAGAPVVVFVATGGTERQVLDLGQFDENRPALLVAHPGHNSLPASLEVLARLQQQGVRGRIVYLAGAEDSEGLGQVAAAVHDLQVRLALRASRIGLVGEPSDWLVASSPSPDVVRSSWGPTVVPISLEALMDEPDVRSITLGDSLARAMLHGATAIAEPAESELAPAGRVHAVLQRLAGAERLDAITVRCFDLVVRKHTTGCLALAQLNDDGIVAGCEGDLVATVAMLWLRLMLGGPSWMANPSRVDRGRGTLLLAHCTVPPSMGTSYRLRSHFESGLGVAIQGALPRGPVTLVRLGGSRMERLRAIDGELVGNTDHADLCRTQAEIVVGREALDDLLADPLGNHVVMVPGHHAQALRRWHETLIAQAPGNALRL